MLDPEETARQRSLDRSAALMPEHHEQRRAQVGAGVLEAAGDFRRQNVTSHPNDEEFAEDSVEDQLGWDARVGTTEYCREWLLALGETGKHFGSHAPEPRLLPA